MFSTVTVASLGLSGSKVTESGSTANSPAAAVTVDAAGAWSSPPTTVEGWWSVTPSVDDDASVSSSPPIHPSCTETPSRPTMAVTTPAIPVTTPGTLDQKGFLSLISSDPNGRSRGALTRPACRRRSGRLSGMAVAVGRMSAAEYLATPESRPRHTELIDGTVVVNEPRLPHARAQTELIYRLRRGSTRAKAGLREHADRHASSTSPTCSPPTCGGSSEHRRPAPTSSTSTAARPGDRDPLAVHLGPRPRRQASPLRGGGRPRGLVRRHRGPDRCSCSAGPRPDAPTFDVVARGGRDKELTSPLLDGFALPVGRSSA